MVGGFARRGVAVKVTLDAVIACAANIDGAALHQEILVARYTVTHGGSDVEGGVLQGHILTRLDAVFHIAHDAECALLGKLGVAFDV